MGAIAIITARGGSKRIPKKNIKDFCGRPIIEYSIEAALKSGVFNEVMVSTDSEEIAEIACKAGASVPFLRSELTSNDYATTRDVLFEVLRRYLEMNCTFEVMSCIYPTAPFVTPQRLVEAYELLIKTGADSVIPVVQYSYPPQRGMILCDGLLKYQFPEYINSRSQDLDPIYHDSGQFYFYKLNSDIEFNSNTFAPIIIPEMEVQDIDTESDWRIAEMKYKILKGKTECE